MGHLVQWIYVYCTDFVINLANVLQLSYYEINALLFCLLYPFLLTGLSGAWLVQRYRLNKWKRKLR